MLGGGGTAAATLGSSSPTGGNVGGNMSIWNEKIGFLR
jgi:hypothetical protein